MLREDHHHIQWVRETVSSKLTSDDRLAETRVAHDPEPQAPISKTLEGLAYPGHGSRSQRRLPETYFQLSHRQVEADAEKIVNQPRHRRPRRLHAGDFTPTRNLVRNPFSAREHVVDRYTGGPIARVSEQPFATGAHIEGGLFDKSAAIVKEKTLGGCLRHVVRLTRKSSGGPHGTPPAATRC